MRSWFLALAISFLCIQLNGQTAHLIGKVSFLKDSLDIDFIDVRLIENGVMKYGTVTDSMGNFSFQGVNFGTYTVMLIGGKGNNTQYTSPYPDEYPSTIVINTESPGSFLFLYTGKCKYHQPSQLKGICPEGHKDKVIPIVYGYPSKKALKEEKKGKLILGGCVVSNCDPNWYCLKHNLRF